MTDTTDPSTGEPIFDSPSGWVKSHIDEYVETGGAKGQRWKGTDTLLLTTRGRKTGKLRRTALIYGTEDGDYVVVASRGGAPDHPAWYLNLSDDPEVSIQVGADLFQGTARTARGDEREGLWAQMSEIWPAYDDYQSKTDREIPIVVIETLN
jgi:deazaflavin-dependent oxidoreductase (nitroreductase family)